MQGGGFETRAISNYKCTFPACKSTGSSPFRRQASRIRLAACRHPDGLSVERGSLHVCHVFKDDLTNVKAIKYKMHLCDIHGFSEIDD